MTNYNPSVDLTIFPRVNFYKTFGPRAVRRGMNGRIFGTYGTPPPTSIDDESVYPPATGADVLSGQTSPVDLGPSVTTTPTALFDLREGSATINLN